MKRREFMALLGGAATWPLAARAQQIDRTRRIGIIPPTRENDPETRARLAAFREALAQLGWEEGRNIRFDYRWSGGDAELMKVHAKELVASAPDLILTGITPAVQALKRETRSIPIVFANVADPIGSGLVPSLAKPGGNVTGFTAVEYDIVGKWLELLKELAPDTERVALIGNSQDGFAEKFLRSLQEIAPSFGVRPILAEVRNAADIERSVDAFAGQPKGGLLTVPAFTATIHRAIIFRVAALHRLPAVYPFRFYAADGGLASYGPDQVEQYRRAADYVDRILRGAKPADLPVQAPTKFDLVINLKTAKALGLDVPPTLLARAMRRREFITLLGGAAAAWPLAARAQQPGKIPKIGFFFPGTETVAPTRIRALAEGLQAAGYRAPDQVELITRVTGGNPSRVAPMAAELIERNVDVLVAASPAAVHALRSLTSTVPIVAYDLETDPIGSGIVKSLSQPGGNITGVFFDFPEFSKKWLELMKEALPRLAKISVLWDPATGFRQLRAIEQVAGVMNLEVSIVEVRALAELDAGMAAASRNSPDALVMLSSPIIGGSYQALANFTLQRRLAAVTLFPDFARSGGLMGYGPNINNGYHQTARIVAKVLQGAKPAELPVELPTKFELVINLKTANAIGIEFPTSLLLRADEVIE